MWFPAESVQHRMLSSWTSSSHATSLIYTAIPTAEMLRGPAAQSCCITLICLLLAGQRQDLGQRERPPPLSEHDKGGAQRRAGQILPAESAAAPETAAGSRQPAHVPHH